MSRFPVLFLLSLPFLFHRRNCELTALSLFGPGTLLLLFRAAVPTGLLLSRRLEVLEGKRRLRELFQLVLEYFHS